MKSQTVLKRENKFFELIKNIFESIMNVPEVTEIPLPKELADIAAAADRYAEQQDSLLGTSTSAEIDNTRRVTTSSVGTSIHRTTPNRSRDMEISR